MRGLISLVLLAVLAVVQAEAADNDCTTLVQNVKNGVFENVQELLPGCTELNEVEDALSNLRRQLNDVSSIITQLKSKTITTAPIEPAIQWAQSPDSVFVQVKFAHKLDAPACIDVLDPVVEINDNQVSVRAGCKNFDKHYKLDIQLFSAIVAANSSWSMTSVGRGSFTLAKQVVAKWDRLLASRDKPKNLHVWWAMQEKFDDALEKLKSAPAVEKNVEKPVEEEPKEDDLDVGKDSAKKRLQEHARKTKIDIEQKFTAQKNKLQKEIDKIEEERKKEVSKLDTNLKTSLSKLDEKLASLKAKRKAGEDVKWVDDKESDASFFKIAAEVMKKALGVEGAQKDEV